MYDKHNDSCGPLRSTTEQVEMEAAKFAKSGTECVRVCVRERKKIDAESDFYFPTPSPIRHSHMKWYSAKKR